MILRQFRLPLGRVFTMFHPSTCTILILIFALNALERADGQTKMEKRSVTYRTVDQHSIQADVYRLPGTEVCPVIVWIHGGALIMGGREGVPNPIRAFAEENQVAIVSIDYRLAPETKLPDIISDVEAAFHWLANEGKAQFHLDTNHIAVCGGSAGGYLTLVTGYRVKPRPRALVAFYGYGHLTREWYAAPSPHPRHNPRTISADEAAQQTDGSIISNAQQRKGDGRLIYMHYRQQGIWPLEVSGFDEATLAAQIVSFEPIKNVTADYPPTLLIHGTHDTDVPYEESAFMTAALKRNDVIVHLKTIENGEHGLTGGDPNQIDEAYAFMREFLKASLFD